MLGHAHIKLVILNIVFEESFSQHRFGCSSGFLLYARDLRHPKQGSPYTAIMSAVATTSEGVKCAVTVQQNYIHL